MLNELAAGNKENILSVPLVEQLARSLMPSLLDGSEVSRGILREIAAYLVEKHYRRAPALEKKLPEELYVALYGLKCLLESHRNNNINVVSWSAEEHKRRFGLFLEEALEEEE